jgi:hypothetical protein
MKKITTLLKSLVLSAALFCISNTTASAQTLIKDTQGNLKMSERVKDHTQDVNTGKFLIDLQGNKWPLFQSKTGKLYALRTSKSGKEYKQYINTDQIQDPAVKKEN